MANASSEDIGFNPADYEGLEVTIDLKNTISNDLTAYDIRTTVRELIQNADDAGASKVCVFFVGSDPMLPDLVVVGNDAEFRVVAGQRDDISRFRRFHSRGKESETTEVIGKFGIGRVACYHVADEPTVVTKVNRKVWMELPLDLDLKRRVRQLRQPEDIDLVEHWRAAYPGSHDELATLFLLKVRHGETAISRELRVPPVDHSTFATLAATLTPDSLMEMLLFLEHVETVEIWAGGKPTVLQRDERRLSLSTLPVHIKATRREFRINGEPNAGYLVLSTDTKPISSGTADDPRHWGRRVAFSWQDGAPAPVQEARLHCYLPTSIRTGLAFHIHASFFVKMDRADLKSDNASDASNRLLLGLLGQLFVDAIPALRDWTTAAGVATRFYEVFPISLGPTAPPACDALLQAVWRKPALEGLEIILDQTGVFRNCSSVQLAASRGLYDLFEGSSVCLVHGDLAEQHNCWLQTFENAVGKLKIFAAADAIDWLNDRLEQGVPIAALERTPDAAGSVLRDESSYIRLLEELRAFQLEPTRLSDTSLALAADGKLWPFDENLREAEQELRDWLNYWEQRFEPSEGAALPSAYLIHPGLPGELRHWLSPVVPKADTRFFLERVAELHASTDETKFLAKLGGRRKAIQKVGSFLKFIGKLEGSEQVGGFPGPLIVGLDRGESLLRAGDGPHAVVPRKYLHSFFREDAVKVVHPDLVDALGALLPKLSCFRKWRASDLRSLDRALLPRTGEMPRPSLQPPFQSEENLLVFLKLLNATWDEEAAFIAELPIYLSQDSHFSALRAGSTVLIHRAPEGGAVSKELDALEGEFPSPQVLASPLCQGPTRALIADKLGTPALDSWGYLVSSVIPGLQQRTDRPDLFMSFLVVLRRLDVLEEWEKEPARRDQLGEELFVLTACGRVLSPSSVYETRAATSGVLGDDVPVLHSIYHNGPKATVRNHLDYLRQLGVATSPRPADLVASARNLALAQQSTSESIGQTRRILECLKTFFPLTPEVASQLLPLKMMAWLPAQRRSMRKVTAVLFTPAELVSSDLAFLIWSQEPCLSCDADAELLQWLGVKQGDLSAQQVIRHLLFLRDTIRQGAVEDNLEDLRGCLSELVNCSESSELRRQAIFPVGDESEPSFVRYDQLLPASEKKKLGAFWKYYISRSDKGYELALAMGMPDCAGTKHYVELLVGLSEYHRASANNGYAPPLTEGDARLYGNALRALSQAEDLGHDLIARLKTNADLFCIDNVWRPPHKVWIADRGDLRLAFRQCNTDFGAVENRAEALAFFAHLNVPYLSESHRLKLVRANPAAAGSAVPAELRDWKHPARVQAYLRCWNHFVVRSARESGKTVLPEKPTFQNLIVKLVDEILVQDQFSRDNVVVVTSEPRRELSAMDGSVIYLPVDAGAVRAREGLADCLAAFMSRSLVDPPEQAHLLFEKILQTPVEELANMLDRNRISIYAATTGISWEDDEEGRYHNESSTSDVTLVGSVPETVANNADQNTADSVATELELEEVALLEMRENVRSAPRPSGTREDKVSLWNRILTFEERRAKASSRGKDVFVRSHFRTRPGEGVGDRELDLLWNFCYTNTENEEVVVNNEDYICRVENALRFGGMLADDRVLHHLTAVRRDLPQEGDCHRYEH